MSSDDAASENEQLRRDLARLHELRQQLLNLEEETSASEHVPTPVPATTTGFGDELGIFVLENEQLPSNEQLPAVPDEQLDPNNQVKNLRRCLDLNLEYQTRIRGFIDLIKSSKVKLDDEISKKMEEISREKKLREAGEVKRPVPVIYRSANATLACFRKPYFRSVYGIVPPPNEDLKTKSYNGEMLPGDEYYESGWKWDDESLRDRLFREVRRECLAKFLEPHIQHRDELRSIVLEIDGVGLERARRDLEEAEKTIKRVVREVENKDLFGNKQLIDRVDWLKVAKNMGGNINHMTFRLVWSNYLSPVINKKPFAAKEDKDLQRIAMAHRRKRWARIAELMGTGRSPFQLAQRYQSKFAPFKKMRAIKDELMAPWSREDDERLIELVSSLDVYSSDDKATLRYIDWQFVAQNTGNFSKKECIERYVYLSSGIKKGLWSEDDDKRLNEAIETYGTSNWLAVATYVGNRSPYQCRVHYQTVLVRRNHQKLLGQRGQMEWTAEEDSILWFNRMSSNVKLRQWNEIAQLLPNRLKTELQDRFRLLKLWQKHAFWVMKNEGSLLSLVTKSDADLSFAEVERLKHELTRLQDKRRLENPTRSGIVPLGAVTFAEQGQLERLTNALVLEANLSRDLVRSKVQLLRDIVNQKAVPLPILRNLPRSDVELEKRELVHGKIREMLIKAVVAQRKRQEESSSRKTLRMCTYSTPHGFGCLIRKFDCVLRDSRTVDKGKELLLRLEAVKGGQQVSELLDISRKMYALIRRARYLKYADFRLFEPAPYSVWIEHATRIRLFYRRQSLIIRSLCGNPTFYWSEIVPRNGTSHKRQFVHLKESNAVAKLLVAALGTNLEGVTAEATRQRDMDEPRCCQQQGRVEDEEDENSEEYNEFSHFMPLIKAVKVAARLRRLRAIVSLQALQTPTDDPSTARGAFPSIRKEFNQTSHITPEDFADNDLSPILPPNTVTTMAYRTLQMTKIRLQDLVDESCSSTERQSFVDTIEALKEHPTEGYALLQRRFEALFTWPSIMERAQTQFFRKSDVPFVKKEPPRTPADIPDVDDPNFGEDLVEESSSKKVSWDVRLKRIKRRIKEMNKYPFLFSRRKARKSTSLQTVRPPISRSTKPYTYKMPPTHREPRSERIRKLFQLGKIQMGKLGGLSEDVVKKRARIVAKAAAEVRQKKFEEEMGKEAKRVEAGRQLNFLVPFVPLIPMDGHPFPETRIPQITRIEEPVAVPRLNFALELAERAILRYHNEEVNFEDRDNSFPPTAHCLPEKRRRKKENVEEEATSESAAVDFTSPALQVLKRSVERSKKLLLPSSKMESPTVKKKAKTSSTTASLPSTPAQIPIPAFSEPRTPMQVPVTVFSPGQLGSTQIPMTLFPSPAVEGGSAQTSSSDQSGEVTFLQLRYEDVVRLFAEGTGRTVAIAVPIPTQQQPTDQPSSTSKK